MDYLLYLGTDLSFLEMKKVLLNIFNSIEGTEIYKDQDKELSIGCNWFSLFFNAESEGIAFASEDYELNLRFQLWFELLYSIEGEGSIAKMMYVIGRILKQTEGDIILMWNGEVPILMRKNRALMVDNKLRSPEDPRFPFDQLGMEYVEGDLE